MKKPDDPDKDELSTAAREMRAANPYFSAVWKLVGGAFFGVLGGYFIDRWFGTKPWGIVGLSTVSIGVGFYAFIRDMVRLEKR